MLRLVVLCSLLFPGLALAREARPAAKPAHAAEKPVVPLTPPAMCEAAISGAEAVHGLPARVLAAISLRESGRNDPSVGRARPWPWTINFEGAGHFYATKEDAIEAVREIQIAGGQSIDVGCMQVNLMYHPNAFSSLEEAFDPPVNAAYSGRFLKNLFAGFSDWGMAIAAYHSRTPGKGEAYRDQVVATWRPTDPAVLARLTMTPLPSLGDGGSGFQGWGQPGMGIMGGGLSRGALPIVIGPSMAYRAFSQSGMLQSTAYRSFQPVNVAYAAFSPKMGKKNGRGMPRVYAGRALDLRLDSGLANSGKALVTPKAVIDRTSLRSERPAARRGS